MAFVLNIIMTDSQVFAHYFCGLYNGVIIGCKPICKRLKYGFEADAQNLLLKNTHLL